MWPTVGFELKASSGVRMGACTFTYRSEDLRKIELDWGSSSKSKDSMKMWVYPPNETYGNPLAPYPANSEPLAC